jgi:hypothetical protein
MKELLSRSVPIIYYHKLLCWLGSGVDRWRAGPVGGAGMAEPWRRVREEGWPIHEVNTVHQITPDPQPRAGVLLETLGN